VSNELVLWIVVSMHGGLSFSMLEPCLFFGKLLVNLLAEDHSRANESGKHRIVLEGYGYRWYRVGGLDYILRRSDI